MQINGYIFLGSPSTFYYIYIDWEYHGEKKAQLPHFFIVFHIVFSLNCPEEQTDDVSTVSFKWLLNIVYTSLCIYSVQEMVELILFCLKKSILGKMWDESFNLCRQKDYGGVFMQYILVTS